MLELNLEEAGMQGLNALGSYVSQATAHSLYNWTVSFVGCFAKLVLTGLFADCAEHSISAQNNQEGI